MDFRLWLETNVGGAYSWFKNSPKEWIKSQIGDTHYQTLGTYIDSSRVSMDQSPFHPLMKRALYVLIKQFPELKDRKIEFDGFHTGTITDYLKDKSYEKRTNEKRLPEFFYHGTSFDRLEIIKDDGLRPRNATGLGPTHGKQNPSNPKYVYLSAIPGSITRFAAYDSANQTKSDSVVLKIESKGLNPKLFVADEDSKKHTWQGSIHELGTVAYNGIIDPEFISIYKIRIKGNWIDPPVDKDDWLSDFMKTKIHDLPSILGTTAKAGWVNPKG